MLRNSPLFPYISHLLRHMERSELHKRTLRRGALVCGRKEVEKALSGRLLWACFPLMMVNCGI